MKSVRQELNFLVLFRQILVLKDQACQFLDRSIYYQYILLYDVVIEHRRKSITTFTPGSFEIIAVYILFCSSSFTDVSLRCLVYN
jgi:hypothetical protein